MMNTEDAIKLACEIAKAAASGGNLNPNEIDQVLRASYLTIDAMINNPDSIATKIDVLPNETQSR